MQGALSGKPLVQSGNARLAEAEAWAGEHAGLLIACFKRFLRTGRWPTLEQLQHDFELDGRDEDVSRIAFAMPPLLGSVEQQRLVLLVRGLAHVPQAAALLDDWATVLGFAYKKWRADPTAKLTRADVLRLLGGDPERARFAALLLLRERWAFGSGYGEADDEWWQEIISAVRDAREAKGPADILAARDRTEFPPAEPLPGPDPLPDHPRRPGFLKRAWQVINKNPLISNVVAGIVILLVGAYFIHSSTSGGGSSGGGGGEAQLGNSTSSGKSGDAASGTGLSSNPRVRIVELTGSWSEDNFIEAVFERNTSIVALYLKSGMSATTLHKGASAILWGFQGLQNGDPIALIKTFQAAGFKIDKELQDSFLMSRLTEETFPLHFETDLAPKGYSPRDWRGEFIGSLLFWIVERASWAGPGAEDIEVMDYLISQGANCSVPLSFLEFNRDALGGTRPYRELLSMMQSCA